MSFPRYPEYNDSGVEWLGEVPAHWDIQRLKHVLSQITDRSTERVNPVALENIEGWSGRYVEGSSDYSGDGVAFREGDLLFGKLRPYLAKVYLPVRPGEAVGDFHVMRPCQYLSAKYAFHQLLQPQFISVVDGATHGAKMPRVGWEVMGNMPFVTPPNREQAQIATFLDHETARIDALVEQQQRLIELLKEKRQAVISHAVTKGLDPDVPMKDSGVEWLGEVPAHWEIKKIRHVAVAIIGLTYAPEDVQDSGELVLRSGNIQKGKIDLQDCVYVEKFIPSKLRLVSGDILICSRNGSRDLVGKNALIDSNVSGATFGAFMTVLRSKYNNFLFYILNSHIFDVQAGSFMTSTVNQLTTSNLYSMEIPFPPKEEQLGIAAYLKSSMEEIASLEGQAGSAINLLKERRSALISAAVTGKIDVRGWQADQYVEQPEMLMAAEGPATYGYDKEEANEV